MDTKLKKYKNNNSKVINDLIVILIVFLLAVAVIASYTTGVIGGKEIINKESFKTERFSNYIAEQIYPRYFEMKKDTEGVINPSDVFTDDKTIDKYYNSYLIDKDELAYNGDPKFENIKINENSYREIIKSYFNEQFDMAYSSELLLNDGYGITDINIYNKENKKFTGNENKDLKYLRENNTSDKDKINKGKLNYINNRYVFYAVIDFDENGDFTIKNFKGGNKEGIERNIQGTIHNSEVDISVAREKYSDYEKNLKYRLPAVKNAVISIGIKGDSVIAKRSLGNYGNYGGLMNIIFADYYTNINNFVIALGTILFILSFVIPEKYINDTYFLRRVKNIPLEIVIFISIMGIAIFGVNIYQSINQNVISPNVFSIIFWTILFASIILVSVYIRGFFSGSGRENIKNNLMINKIIKFTNVEKEKLKKWFEEADSDDKDREKRIGLLILINFVVIIIISRLVGIIDILLAILYSIYIYRLISKRMDKTTREYKKLKNMTDNITQGNLKSECKEDMGIFNPVRDNLNSIQEEFKKAVDEEVKSRNMKTELITNVSHDLKTPLTSIITYVDLLKNENITDEEREKYIATIDKKSQRLKFLIDDLFEISRAASGNIEMHSIRLDVVALMKQTLFELDDKIETSGITIRTKFPSDKIMINLDNMRTFRIFSNLISNITKYSAYNTRAYVEIKENDENVEIEFKNISAEEIEGDINNLTERFVRGDKSRNTDGSGLGLAIAKSFTELQGGSMNLSSDGDLFKVRIVFPKLK